MRTDFIQYQIGIRDVCHRFPISLSCSSMIKNPRSTLSSGGIDHHPKKKKTLTMPNEDKCLAISAKEPLICTDYSKINRHTAVLHVSLFNGGTRRQKTDGE